MPVYRLIRHVIYRPGSQETQEVWGIDRAPARMPVVGAPRFTDADDPLRRRDCSPLLVLRDGDYVRWDRLFEWIGEAETAGYTIISGFKNLSPYSTIVVQGP